MRVIDLREGDRCDEGNDARDVRLLARVRHGDDEAYGELWALHLSSARRVAAKLVPRADVEDLVSEAFERTLAAIRSGHGPETSFFPYVARALRGRAATLLAGKARITLADDDATLDAPVEDADPFHGYPAKTRLVQAFQDLPTRWQDALWVSVVQAEPPRRAAAFLGTSPNGVSAMLIRARRRLRANFIDLSAAESRNPLCREAIQKPSRHADHLVTCDHCAATLAGLAELDVSLRSRGLPVAVLLGGAFSHVAAPHRRLRDLFAAVPAKVAVAAVAVTAAGVTAGPYLLAPSGDNATVRPSVAAGPTRGDVNDRPTRPTGSTTSTVLAAGPAQPAVLPTTPPALRPHQPIPAAGRPASRPSAAGTVRAKAPADRGATSHPAAPPETAPTGTRHPVGIQAQPDAACGCARVTITGVRRNDRIIIRTTQAGAGSHRMVVHPSRAGTLELTVAGRPTGSGRLQVSIAVVRHNGRTVTAKVAVQPH